jgi:hypothetical protein
MAVLQAVPFGEFTKYSRPHWICAVGGILAWMLAADSIITGANTI